MHTQVADSPDCEERWTRVHSVSGCCVAGVAGLLGPSLRHPEHSASVRASATPRHCTHGTRTQTGYARMAHAHTSSTRMAHTGSTRMTPPHTHRQAVHACPTHRQYTNGSRTHMQYTHVTRAHRLCSVHVWHTNKIRCTAHDEHMNTSVTRRQQSATRKYMFIIHFSANIVIIIIWQLNSTH